MTQQPEKPQQTLDIIRNQHKALLLQVEGPGEVDLDQVRKLLKTLAQAGTTIEDAEDRSLLHELIRYWSSFINDKTGEFPAVQLQPFDASLIHSRKMPRRQVLIRIGLSIAGVALVAGGGIIVYWEVGRNKPLAPPPPPSPSSISPQPQFLLTYHGHTNEVDGVAWSPDGKSIASGSRDWQVHVWDSVSGNRLYTYKGHTDLV